MNTKYPPIPSRQQPHSEPIVPEQVKACGEGEIDTLTHLDSMPESRDKKLLDLHTNSQLKSARDSVGCVTKQNEAKSEAQQPAIESFDLGAHPLRSRKGVSVESRNALLAKEISGNITHLTTVVRATYSKKESRTDQRTCDPPGGILMLKQGSKHSLADHMLLIHHICMKPPDVEKRQRRHAFSWSRVINPYSMNHEKNTGPPWILFREQFQDALCMQNV